MKTKQQITHVFARILTAIFLAVTTMFVHVEIVGAANNAQPEAVGTRSTRWIEVNLVRQRLNAWENGKIVMTSLVSSGKARTPTVRGTYYIYVKLASTRMRGCCPAYDTPNVPWTMYFYSGYGIHGAYWHNSFGTPVSHGCVNLPVATARRLFNWASVGTKVVIY